jgi:hypothetical protein
MSAIVPAEACPVARTCPKCGKELPAEAEKCPLCEAASMAAEARPETRFCPVCTKEMPLRARKCLECGEYVNWKGRLTSVTGIVALAGTVIGLVTGILIAIEKWPTESQTKVKITGFSDDAMRLAIQVTNSGKKDAYIDNKFKLTLDAPKKTKPTKIEPSPLDFGPMRHPTPALSILIPGDKPPIDLDLAIRYIYSAPAVDVSKEDFWTRYRDWTVTLAGTVHESNGKERLVTGTLPLIEMKKFIQMRATAPPTPDL